MKTLMLMRHAKAAWPETEIPDRDRELKSKGHRQAERMSAHLGGRLEAPQRIYCSDARRTRETLPPFLRAWSLAEEEVVVYEPGLYLATDHQLLEEIARWPDGLDRVMLVGHNPGLTDLVNRLTSRETYLKNLRPCAVVVLTLPVKAWAEILPGTAAVSLHLRPKELKEE